MHLTGLSEVGKCLEATVGHIDIQPNEKAQNGEECGEEAVEEVVVEVEVEVVAGESGLEVFSEFVGAGELESESEPGGLVSEPELVLETEPGGLVSESKDP